MRNRGAFLYLFLGRREKHGKTILHYSHIGAAKSTIGAFQHNILGKTIFKLYFLKESLQIESADYNHGVIGEAVLAMKMGQFDGATVELHVVR